MPLLSSSTAVFDHVVTALSRTSGPIAVMAGHFALVQDPETGRLIPGIASDIEYEPTRQRVSAHHYMGEFPLETWRVGIEVVHRLRVLGRDVKLLVLVNDWQHVPPAVSGARNAARDAFFANAPFPSSFLAELRRAGLDESVILTDKRDGGLSAFWAESRLRARYNRHLKLRVPVESPCAQEWVPILARLEELKYGGFAAFVPRVCRVPIVGGTERAEECLDLTLKSVIVSPSGENDFWANTWIDA